MAIPLSVRLAKYLRASLLSFKPCEVIGAQMYVDTKYAIRVCSARYTTRRCFCTSDPDCSLKQVVGQSEASELFSAEVETPKSVSNPFIAHGTMTPVRRSRMPARVARDKSPVADVSRGDFSLSTSDKCCLATIVSHHVPLQFFVTLELMLFPIGDLRLNMKAVTAYRV